MPDAFEEILRVLAQPINQHITQEIGALMATVEEIRDQLATQITDLKASLSAALDRVAEDVTHLQEQVAAGNDIDASVFDSVTASLGEVKTSLDALDPLSDFPVPQA